MTEQTGGARRTPSPERRSASDLAARRDMREILASIRRLMQDAPEPPLALGSEPSPEERRRSERAQRFETVAPPPRSAADEWPDDPEIDVDALADELLREADALADRRTRQVAAPPEAEPHPGPARGAWGELEALLSFAQEALDGDLVGAAASPTPAPVASPQHTSPQGRDEPHQDQPSVSAASARPHEAASDDASSRDLVAFPQEAMPDLSAVRSAAASESPSAGDAAASAADTAAIDGASTDQSSIDEPSIGAPRVDLTAPEPGDAAPRVEMENPDRAPVSQQDAPESDTHHRAGDGGATGEAPSVAVPDPVQEEPAEVGSPLASPPEASEAETTLAPAPPQSAPAEPEEPLQASSQPSDTAEQRAKAPAIMGDASAPMMPDDPRNLPNAGAVRTLQEIGSMVRSIARRNHEEGVRSLRGAAPHPRIATMIGWGEKAPERNVDAPPTPSELALKALDAPNAPDAVEPAATRLEPETPPPAAAAEETAKDRAGAAHDLKPLLADWLSQNLSELIQELVREEMRRLPPKE